MKLRFSAILAFVLLTISSANGQITGSFIQSWLIEEENWDDARWQEEFTTLREAGMDMLIFMQTVATDTLGNTSAVYPTKIEGVQPAKKDLLDACLRNAEKNGFKIFVGLNFDDRWWNVAGWTPQWITDQITLGNKVAAELIENYKSRYPNTFVGWYWVWEVEDSFCRAPGITDYLIAALNGTLDFLNNATPEMPVLLSPFMNKERSTPEACAETWSTVLSKAHFKDGDIFAPQDCIGSGFLSLDVVEDWYAALSKIIPTSPKIQFWANIEQFDQRFWTTATMDRIAKQIEIVRPYVQGYISFAYSHYYSPKHKSPAFHKAHSTYMKTGKMADFATPRAIENLQIVADSDSTFLTWEITSDDSSVGYYIYRDGSLVGDIQKNSLGQCRNRWKLPQDSKGCRFSIRAYNACGAKSHGTEIIYK